ncbi:MAG: PAS domain S-box protein, partial [Candidatus Methanofastidiosa archaeon]|nr:PAS domain S-box protein [Candidatus Methanofastidiosa archaeon]
MKAKVTLLHVEDDTDFAHVVHLHLNRIALQRAAPSLSFTVATSVDQALALLEDSSFDAILCDYQICGGTGLDVLARVRVSGLDIPFIFFTGQGDESVAREAFVSGADDYYAKDMGIAAYERIYNALVHQISHYSMEREKLEYKKRVDVSEQRYHLLFSSAPDAIFVLGNRSFVDCNPAAEAMFGYSREELLGRMPHELSPAQQPDGLASLEKAQMQMDRVLDGASHRFTWEHLRKDGSTFAADVFLTTFSDGSEEYLLAMVRDLSDAQRTARQLAEQRRKLSSLIGNLPGMAYQCSTDPDERIRYVSRGVNELLGGSRRELALYPSGSLSALVHPGDRAARQASIERAVSAGEHYDIAYRMRKK